jgi:hypothetical protein
MLAQLERVRENSLLYFDNKEQITMENQTSTPTPTFSMPPVAPMPPVMPIVPVMPPTTTPPPVERPPVVPPSYIPPVMPNVPERKGGEARVILPALLLVLIIGGAYYWYVSNKPGATPYVPVTTTTTTPAVAGQPAQGVEIAKSDISAGSQNKLPDGFPAGLPIELSNITNSTKVVYTDHGVTQYTVSYTSKKTAADLWTAFNAYVTANGYKLDTANTSKSLGILRASKDKLELSVAISSAKGLSLVQISLLQR